MANLWGGRFTTDLDSDFAKFNASFGFDYRLLPYDLKVSMAYSNALTNAGVLSADEYAKLQSGLKEISSRAKDPYYIVKAVDSQQHEDIHSFIEYELYQNCGSVAHKLHTGRSRNDQVATVLRLFVKDHSEQLITALNALIAALAAQAKANPQVYLPGYTHLQRAQPILWPHYLLSFIAMLERDIKRLRATCAELDYCPLGSGALSGTSFPIDRERLAQDLGFSRITVNSVDAVSDRDFVLDFMHSTSVTMVHLSRLAEDLILYNSQEFNFISLSDKVATGSSLMPQKKNPDGLELIRGKVGRVVGHQMALLMTIKGLPSSYNKDLQEDKEGLFDAIFTTNDCVKIMTTIIEQLSINAKVMQRAASLSYSNATELADYLVNKGLPFREAHKLVGEIVSYCIEQQTTLNDLRLEQYQQFHSGIEEDVYYRITMTSTINAKNVPGGTAAVQVEKQLQALAGYII